MSSRAVEIVKAYFEGVDLVEGVEMTILEEGRPLKLPICVCDPEGPDADQILKDLQEQAPPVNPGPLGVFGSKYPHFRKVYLFCKRTSEEP